MEKKPLLLYLDIPFCPVRCRHCVKPALKPLPELRRAYLQALRREAEGSAGSVDDYEVQAVWIGGGIAGHMADEELGELLRQLPRWFPFCEEAEITLKVHPGMIGAETRKACRLGGVTRLSVEYVTKSLFESEALGRFLNPAAMEVSKMVLNGSLLRESFDVVAGLPGQTKTSLTESLEAALSYGAGHISLYPLRLAAGSALEQEWREKQEALQKNPRRRLAEAAELAALIETGGHFLQERGMREYLPGHWAFPGNECRYLRLEAAGAECLAFGLGAVSCLEGIRSWNTAELAVYLRHSAEPGQIICRTETTASLTAILGERRE